MEGIRGFAVFLVFLVHYVTLIEPWLEIDSFTRQTANTIRGMGNIGVDLFFVLSGFLIYGMLIKREVLFFKYLLRRIRRIYPAFTVVFAIYLLLSLVFPAESKIPTQWPAASLYILQNFLLLPGLFNIEAINTVTWSLSYEFFYYLLVPIMMLCLSLRKWPAKYRIWFFIAISFVGFICFAIFGGHVRLLMFVSGILLYEVISNKTVTKMPPLGLGALATSLCIVAVSAELNLAGWSKYLILYILFLIFCLECFVRNGVTRNIFLQVQLRWLGNISYSYYLIHGLALKASFMVIAQIYPATYGDTVLFWWLWIPLFIASLVPSIILFVWIEKPYSLDLKRPITSKSGGTVTLD
jgi:exopolysaccharide production protein ExoZ